MNGQVLRVAWYRFAVTFARRRGGYVSVVLLVGLVGGLAMGAVAGARRTQSSFPAFVASTNPSDLTVASGQVSSTGDFSYDPSVPDTIAHLPHVKRVESVAGFNHILSLSGPNGAPGAPPGGLVPTASEQVIAIGSVDGEFFNQDRVAVIQGRMANAQTADEAVMTAEAARVLGLHVGEVVPLGFYTNAQSNLPDYGTAGVKPQLRIDVKLVGIVVTNFQLVQDDVDRFPTYVLFTPALTRQLTTCCANFATTGVQLDSGSRDLATVETEIGRANGQVGWVTSVVEAKAERAIKPEAIALGVFGGVAALAALFIGGQVIGRQVRLGAADLATLRALGADSEMTGADGLIGILGAVVIGSMLAVAVAVALSPLAPIGPVRPVQPNSGVAFDWTVLALGLVVLIVGLSALAAVLAYRQAPNRFAVRRSLRRGSNLARWAAASGLPPPAVVGIGFALEPGTGRAVVPVRSAILGAALALIVVIATSTFGASLNTLVSHPALYGWNWDYELSSYFGGAAGIPQQQAATVLDHNADVSAWTPVFFGAVEFDGRTVPVLDMSPKALIAPPVLSGHGVEAADQVVLGATTLAQLQKHVGDTVVVSFGNANNPRGHLPPTTLRIVGTASMPTIGTTNALHTTMGTGAILSLRQVEQFVGGDPNAIFVRVRHGMTPTAAYQSLQAIADRLNANGPVAVLSVQRPAEIVNYRSMGTTPALLGAGLAAGAVTALGLTLVASVRRRRRDLALVKTLGFTKRQLAAVVAWQSSIAVAIGTLVGVPLGIALGRFLWDLFAHEIHVVPQPTVPVLSIVLVAVGALVLANLVAALPGREAAHTPTALLLRTE